MKRFKLVDATEALTASAGPFRWDLCIFCQQDTSEIVQCPLASKRTDVGAGYKSVSLNLQKFHDANALPQTVHYQHFNDGTGIELTLAKNKAVWHKSCRNMYNTTKLERVNKRKVDSIQDVASSSVDPECLPSTSQAGHFTRSFGVPAKTYSCFFCDKSNEAGTLHAVSTFEVDYRVRKCAEKLQDSALLTKLSIGDLIATEAKYHAPCLASLYKQAANAEKKDVGIVVENTSDSLAFAQLIEYITEVQSDSTIAPVFKLSELIKKYEARLQQVGVSTDNRINATRLKERLLFTLP